MHASISSDSPSLEIHCHQHFCYIIRNVLEIFYCLISLVRTFLCFLLVVKRSLQKKLGERAV